ncbi:hypothetical protein QR680_011999 [Steinernema hermaphroditum]|uniref:C2H2-type domain-containing protein n=1 Tax=Steinernema hermaphroditum TaxID=289476 RepID=A0AA39LZZ0_9BILA|nr:hypothetical protein QR680_011999 [Steinernema hermaphroditum]
MTDLGSAAFPANGSPHRLDGGTEEEVIGEPAALQCQACSAKVCEWDQKDVDKHIASHTENPCACFFRGCDRTFQCPLTFRVHVLKKHGLAPDQLAPELREMLEESRDCRRNLKAIGLRHFLDHIAFHEETFCECPIEECEQHLESVPEIGEHSTDRHEPAALNEQKHHDHIDDSVCGTTVPRLENHVNEEKAGTDQNVGDVNDAKDAAKVESAEKELSLGASTVDETTSGTTVGFTPGTWQCQHCNATVKARGKRDLMQHAMKHEDIMQSSPCFIEGCPKICHWGYSLRAHLMMKHRISAGGLTSEQRQKLIESERAFFEKMEPRMEKYFPPQALISKTAWLCQQCHKEVKVWHVQSLLSHIGSHEYFSCACPIEGCNRTYKNPTGLRNHLKSQHKLIPGDMNGELRNQLLGVERNFYDSAKDHLGKYFPAEARLEQPVETVTST